MKIIVSILFIWLNLIPAWGQLFSPKEIKDIQNFFLHFETKKKTVPQNDAGDIILPYGLNYYRWTNKIQRPEVFQPYFWDENNPLNSTSNTLRDTLRLNGKYILILDSPLLDFKEIIQITLPNKRLAVRFGSYLCKLDAYRGYTAQWSIESDSLFLLRVSPYHNGEYYWGDTVSQEVLNPLIEKLTGQRFINGKLFAGWVNGKIVGGSGGIYLKRELDKYELESLANYPPEEILRRQYTGHYLYPEEYSFWIEDGLVKQTDHLKKE